MRATRSFLRIGAVVVLLAPLLAGGCGTLTAPTLVTRAAGDPAALAGQLDSLFDAPEYSNAFWGVRVETSGGRLLYDRNGAKQFAPASNMKIVTTAAGLDVLGADYTYETCVEAIGTIRADGTLDGDLLIIGSGDPSLGAWHPDKSRDSRQLLEGWAVKIKQAGIRAISGDIIGDGRCFTIDGYSPGWDYGDLPYWYASPPSGLAIEENAFRCIIRPGAKVGDPATIELIPQTRHITLINQTRTVEAGGTSNADSTWQQAEGNTRRFVGTIAIDKKEIAERGAVWDGAAYAACLFKEQLEREGIPVGGKAVNIRDLADPARIDDVPPDRRRLIAAHTSPPMSELVKVVNKPSHNFFADQILRTIGRRKGGEGSFEAGAKVVRAWLADIGAPQAETLQMFDGSGLARDNFVQPRQICHILRYMRGRGAAGAAFYDSLPIGAVDGTLEERLKDPATAGKVHAKTGYISNVRALSGYVPDATGGELVFSMICNQYTIPTRQVNATQDAAAKVLASLRTRVE